MTTVPTTLDRQFRDAAAVAGLLDVSYDIADTPIGWLLVAVTERGLCRISFDPEPDRETEQLARAFGARVLRAPRFRLSIWGEFCRRGVRSAARPSARAASRLHRVCLRERR